MTFWVFRSKLCKELTQKRNQPAAEWWEKQGDWSGKFCRLQRA